VTETETWGPEIRGRRRRRGRVVLLVVLGLIAFLILAWVGAAAYASARIDRVSIDGLQMAGFGRANFLVVGSDSRGDLTEEQRRELTTGTFEGQRADTIMVMTVGARSSAILSFPRDLVVERCDGSVGRINAAIAHRDGPSCLVQTVESLSGIPIHHYVEIGFLGFVEMVEAVGGVEMCLDEPIADPKAGIDLPAGCQVLDGPDALGYVRTRQVGADLGRIQRQKEFMRALAVETASPVTLLHLPRLYRTAGALGNSLTADSGFRVTGPVRFGVGAMTMAMDRTITETVPNTPDGARLRVVESEAEPIFAAFRDGSVLREARGASRTAISPSDVEVAVLNGSGISGLATRVADELRAQRFVVVDVGNAEPLDATVVRHPPGQQDGAELVARQLPRGVTVEESADVSVVTVILGADAEG
jgi:LCP family protein required for cell wall assembly